MGGNITVLNPAGYPPGIEQQGLAKRPGSLEDKPVYLVDCRFDDGDILMEQMQGWFEDPGHPLSFPAVAKQTLPCPFFLSPATNPEKSGVQPELSPSIQPSRYLSFAAFQMAVVFFPRRSSRFLRQCV